MHTQSGGPDPQPATVWRWRSCGSQRIRYRYGWPRDGYATDPVSFPGRLL